MFHAGSSSVLLIVFFYFACKIGAGCAHAGGAKRRLLLIRVEQI